MLLKLSAVVVFLSLSYAHAASPAADTLVSFERAFVPMGLEGGEMAQVVMAGIFPDSCHKAGNPRFLLYKSSKTIRIWQPAQVSSENCLPMTMPFHSVVSLGVLEPGLYTIQDGVSGRALGKLPIAPAAAGERPRYAPLRDAFVVSDEQTGETSLVLRGNWSDRCTELEAIDVRYYADVVVVRPIVHSESDGAKRCGASRSGFEKRVPLRPIGSGPFLLHVRAEGGNAINKLYGGL
jgi:hypothetical protein